MAEKRKPDDAAQSKRFVDAARRLDADESGKSFDKALGLLRPKKRNGSNNRK